jgi:hypothetical protein
MIFIENTNLFGKALPGDLDKVAKGHRHLSYSQTKFPTLGKENIKPYDTTNSKFIRGKADDNSSRYGWHN